MNKLVNAVLTISVLIFFFAMLFHGVSEINKERAEEFYALREELTKEISMTTVPVQGTKNFTATVRIKYVDGNLKEIVLMPRTTMEKK